MNWNKSQGAVDEQVVDEIYQLVLKEYESEERLRSKGRSKGPKKVHYETIKYEKIFSI
jgi:hypothetical protein